jgi:hypothetical protein
MAGSIGEAPLLRDRRGRVFTRIKENKVLREVLAWAEFIFYVHGRSDGAKSRDRGLRGIGQGKPEWQECAPAIIPFSSVRSRPPRRGR